MSALLQKPMDPYRTVRKPLNSPKNTIYREPAFKNANYEYRHNNSLSEQQPLHYSFVVQHSLAPGIW